MGLFFFFLPADDLGAGALALHARGYYDCCILTLSPLVVFFPLLATASILERGGGENYGTPGALFVRFIVAFR